MFPRQGREFAKFLWMHSNHSRGVRLGFLSNSRTFFFLVNAVDTFEPKGVSIVLACASRIVGPIDRAKCDGHQIWGKLPLLIFGISDVKKVVQSGKFDCPRCGPNIPFKHKNVREYFTLYFLPIIPLDILGEYVECQGCNSTFDAGILSHQAEQFDGAVQALFEIAIFKVLVLMSLADGKVEAEEIKRIAAMCNELLESDISEIEIVREQKAETRRKRSVESYLKEIRPLLNDENKKNVLRAMIFVAGADGEMVNSEFELLRKAAKALHINRKRLKKILAEFVETVVEF
jgi:uncharacterized tellurite resistance protein B-like protein